MSAVFADIGRPLDCKHCKIDRHGYWIFCEPHAAEWKQMHETALAEHRARSTALYVDPVTDNSDLI